MFPVRDDLGSFLFPPSEIRPGALFFSTSCPSPLSVCPFCLLSVHNVYSAAPLQCLVPPHVRTPSSVRRRATNPPAPADQCPLLVSRPSFSYAGLHPPPPDLYGWWYLAWVWVCVEGQKETAPRSVLSPSSRRQASPYRRPSACLRPTLDFPLDSCGPQSIGVPRLVQ